MPIIKSILLTISAGIVSLTSLFTGSPTSTKVNTQQNVLAANTISLPNTDYVFNVNVPANFNKGISAPNVLYSLQPGNGIGISNGQEPTITNKGVISIGGSSGELSLSAGDGISVSGLTITNDDKGSSQSIFKTFSVDGQNDVVASGNTDKIKFAPGVGITLSTNSTDKTITIGSYAAGWTREEPYLFLTNSTDKVGIGTSAPSSKLQVTGDVKISGGLNLLGSGITNAGSIVDATGLTSSGNVTFSGLSNGIVKSSSVGLLSSGTVNISSSSAEISGILSVANGGTGINSFTKGDLLYASSNNVLSSLGIGNEGAVLTINSSGVPAWGVVDSQSNSPCPNCMVIDPGSTQTITPTSVTATGLSIKQSNGGSVDIFSVKNYAGDKDYLKINSEGSLVLGQNASNFSANFALATLTGARTYTLPDYSGNVCLDTGNCAGVGSNLGGSGIIGYVPRWSGLYALENGSIYDNGNVGIGTSTPSAKLDVVGIANISGALTLGSTLNVTNFASMSSSLKVVGTTSLSSTLDVSGSTNLLSTLDVTSNITSNGALKINGTGDSYISGNFGVGNVSPGYKLDVSGIINSTGSYYMSGLLFAGKSGSDLRINDNGSFSNVAITNGNLGIGTATPSAKLDVLQNSNASAFNVAANSVTTATGAAYFFNGLTTGTGVSIQSTSNLNTSSKLLSLSESQNRTSSSGISENLLSIDRNITYSPDVPVITQDNLTENSGTGISTLSLSHTIGSSANMILLAYVSFANSPSARSLSSITYAGQPMTLATSANSNSSYSKVAIYYLVNPPVGTNTLSITLNGSASIHLGAVSYYNVNLSSPFGTPVTASSLLHSYFSVSVTSATNELVTDIYTALYGSTPSVGSGQTVLWNGNYTAPPMAASTKPGASTVTMSLSGSGDYGAYAAIPIKPVSVSSLGISGALVNFSSLCTTNTSTCTDISNILNLSQLTASATGGVISITNAGSGADISFDSSPILRMANGGTMRWDDGTNTLMSLIDSGTVGLLNMYGTASISGSLSFASTSATLDVLNGNSLVIRTSPGGDSGISNRITLLNNGNLGLNTATPGATLDVKGIVRLSGSTSGYVGLTASASAGSTTYTLPSLDGSLGQVLTTNGSGILSWTDKNSSSSGTSTSTSTGTGATLSISQTNVTSSRALATVYQNTTGKPMFVSVSVSRGSTGTVSVYTDSNTPPTTQILATSDSSGWNSSVYFYVVPGNYYKVVTDSSASLIFWYESVLDVSGLSQWSSLNGNINFISGNVGIGTATPSAKLQISANYGGNAALITDQLNSGDLFTASSSGTTKFTIAKNGLVNATSGGLSTFVKSGAVSDTDFLDTAINGLLAVDSTDNRLYVRSGNAWKYIAFTGGFQIPSDETDGLSTGDFLIPYVESSLADGAVHGMYKRFSDVKDSLLSDVYSLITSLTDRIAKLEEAISGYKKNVTTENVCVGTDEDKVCISKDQLKEIVDNLPSPTPTATPESLLASPSPSPIEYILPTEIPNSATKSAD